MFTSTFISLLFTMAALTQNVNNPDAGGQPRSSLESFYVASFNGNEWMIIDVQPLSDSDSKVRFIRVRRACGSFRVQEEDHVFAGISVRQLAGDAAICVPEEKLAREIRRFHPKKEPETEQWRNYIQGIEAQCGTKKVVHHLPAQDLLRFDHLGHKAPSIAALWTLTNDIQQRYNDARERAFISPLRIPPGPPDRGLSEQAAIEIRSGDYDLALPPVVTDFGSGSTTPLSGLIPRPEEATNEQGNIGVVENVSQLALTNNNPIRYPLMAVIAHVQGDVVLKVYVDQPTGAVRSVDAISGHPILVKAASDAISAWKFVPSYSGENPLTLTVHFEVRCPQTLDTTTSTARSSQHRSNKKRKN